MGGNRRFQVLRPATGRDGSVRDDPLHRQSPTCRQQTMIADKCRRAALRTTPAQQKAQVPCRLPQLFEASPLEVAFIILTESAPHPIQAPMH